MPHVPCRLPARDRCYIHAPRTMLYAPCSSMLHACVLHAPIYYSRASYCAPHASAASCHVLLASRAILSAAQHPSASGTSPLLSCALTYRYAPSKQHRPVCAVRRTPYVMPRRTPLHHSRDSASLLSCSIFFFSSSGPMYPIPSRSPLPVLLLVQCTRPHRSSCGRPSPLDSVAAVPGPAVRRQSMA